jgi:Trk K+ transport system NAD-binding subunit
MDARRALRWIRSERRGGLSRRDRVLVYLIGLVCVAVFYTVAYKLAMGWFEDQTVGWIHSFSIVVQSFTTTGYGQDAPLWDTYQLEILSIAMQLTGVGMVFLALPVFLAPWVEERLSRTAPVSVESIRDHVVITGYTPRGQALIDELSTHERPYVVIEPDRELANELYTETDLHIVHGDPELEEDLEAANVAEARAVIADIDDETNASIALAARNTDDCEVITFVEDPDIRRYHEYAGATEVFSPRQLIGESLAKKVTAGVTPQLDGSIEIGEDFDTVELPVQAGSDIVGTTVGESGVRERTGVNIIGP